MDAMSAMKYGGGLSTEDRLARLEQMPRPSKLTLLASNTWGSVGWGAAQNMLTFTLPRNGIVLIDKKHDSGPVSFVSNVGTYGNFLYTINIRTGSYAGAIFDSYVVYSSAVYQVVANAMLSHADMKRLVELPANTYYVTITPTLWAGNANHFGIGSVNTCAWLID